MRRATHHMITMLNVLGLFSLFLVIQKGHAYQFKVGGSGDWSLASCSSYDQWAQKSRFQTGDTLMFNYKANEDSVVQVSEADYKNCSTASPIAKYSDGHTAIKLTQSGPHYFISGVVDHCKNHEKVVIIVLADRNKPSSDTPSPSPSPSAASPPALPPAPASEEFHSPPPAPGAPEPDHTPAPSPSEENPPPPTPNGASSIVSFCSVGAFVGFFILFNF